MDFAKSQGMKLTDKSGRTVPPSELEGKVVALYFSAHWCPPCRGFTPVLKVFYEHIKGKNLPFEIIFVSSDKTESEASEYFRNDHGDWLMLDLGQKGAISDKFKIQGIPSLIVIDSAGKPVVPDARDQVKSLGDWQKLFGDWRARAGSSLGGAAQAQDAAALRAARLARLGGGPPVPAQPTPPKEEAPATPAPVPVRVPAAEPVAQPAVAPGQDPQAIEQIISMGFTAEQANRVLEAAGGNVETAVSLFFDQARLDGGPPVPAPAPAPVSVPAAEPVAQPAVTPGQDPRAIEQLTSMGFTEEQASVAFEAAGGNVETALSFLLDQYYK